MNIFNDSLKKDLNQIISANVEITKGTIGNNDLSIEVKYNHPIAFQSYLYKIESSRDNDFEELKNLKND